MVHQSQRFTLERCPSDGLVRLVAASLRPFALASVLPVALIVFSFIRFRGQRTVHFLQTVNLLCFIWTLFVGSMAVTGDWLRWALTNRWSQLRKN
jgi:4-hydroxybenzoate polyprenyltransferase